MVMFFFLTPDKTDTSVTLLKATVQCERTKTVTEQFGVVRSDMIRGMKYSSHVPSFSIYLPSSITFPFKNKVINDFIPRNLSDNSISNLTSPSSLK